MCHEDGANMQSRVYIAVLCALPQLTWADRLEIDPVSVEAKRTQETSVTEQNTAQAAGDSASLIGDMFGLQLRRGGGVSSLPMMQGLADDRIRIKVDGMDLISSCANHMNPALSYIDPANIAEVKVYSGLAPVSVGGDSIAGSIVVNSAKPVFATDDQLLTQASLNTFYRSNNDAFGVNANMLVANQQVYMRYTGSTVDANNAHAGGSFKSAGLAASDRGWLSADEIGSTAYRSTNHALALGFNLDNHLLEFKLGLQDIGKQGFVNQRMDMTGNQSEQYQLRHEAKFDWGKWQTRLYHEHTQHKMNFGADKQFLYGDAPGMPMNTRGYTTGLNSQVDWLLNSRDTVRLGLDIQRYSLDDNWPASGSGTMMGPKTFQNIHNGQRNRNDIYAEWDAVWSQAWWTQVGLRLSNVETKADAVQGYNPSTTPSMMMGYATAYGIAATEFNAKDRSTSDLNVDTTWLAKYIPDEMQQYEFGYALKMRSPNLYERYTWAATNSMVTNMNNWIGDGNGYVGNVNLRPEKAHTFQLTADWHDAERNDWQIKFTPFYRYIDDYIDAASCASVGYVNAGNDCPARTDGFSNLSLSNQSARMYGFDLNAKKTLVADSAWGSLGAQLDVNYVRGKNTTTHDDLYGIMPLNAKLALLHAYGSWKNRIQTRLVENKSHVETIRNENQTPGYALLDLYASYEWKKARLDVGVENLFDKFYFDPTGGAYLGQGATMGATVFQGLQVPGIGRSVNVAMTLFY
jgi:iron complex outermembrane recepter protein